MEKIEKEVQKLRDVGFLRGTRTGLQILSPSLKRTGRLPSLHRFTLNDACLKDEFPLPIIERILDKTFGYERMSFMDGFSGYNQIKMHPDDLYRFAHSAPLSAFTLI